MRMAMILRSIREKTCDNDYGPAESRAWLETDGGRELNLDYFRHYDEMMSYLLENGIYAHILFESL